MFGCPRRASCQNTPARWYILRAMSISCSGTEYWTSPGVRIEEGEVFRSKDKTPIGILQLLGAIEEESKLCLGAGAGRTAQSQKTEFVGAMNSWEYALPVLKIIEADQRAPIHQVGEEILIE